MCQDIGLKLGLSIAPESPFSPPGRAMSVTADLDCAGNPASRKGVPSFRFTLAGLLESNSTGNPYLADITDEELVYPRESLKQIAYLLPPVKAVSRPDRTQPLIAVFDDVGEQVLDSRETGKT